LNAFGNIAENVPEEADEIADVHDDDYKFEDPDKEISLDQERNLVLVTILILCSNWVIFDDIFKLLLHEQLDAAHNDGYIEDSDACHHSHNLD